jgi:hypothetical protein
MKSIDLIEDALCDAVDVLNILKLMNHPILQHPKDSDGSETTIEDCLENIKDILTRLEGFK